MLATHSETPTIEAQGRANSPEEESAVTVQFERQNGVDRAILKTAEATPADESVLSRVPSAPGLSAWSEDGGAAPLAEAVATVAPRLLNLAGASDSASVSVSGQQLRLRRARVTDLLPTSLRAGNEKSGTGEVTSIGGSGSLNEDGARAGHLRQALEDAAAAASSSTGTCSPDGRSARSHHVGSARHESAGFKAKAASIGGDLANLSRLLNQFHLPPPPPSRGGKFSYLQVVVPPAGSPETDLGLGKAAGPKHLVPGGVLEQLMPLREDESGAGKEQAGLLLYAARGCTPAAMSSRQRRLDVTLEGPGAVAAHDIGDEWATERKDSGHATLRASVPSPQSQATKSFYPYPSQRAVQDQQASLVLPTSPSSLRRGAALVVEGSGGGAGSGVGVGGRGGGGGENALTASGADGGEKPSTFGMISAFNRRSREQQEVWSHEFFLFISHHCKRCTYPEPSAP